MAFLRPILPGISSLLVVLSWGGGSVSAQEGTLRGFVSVEPFEIRLEALVKVEAYKGVWKIDGGTVSMRNRQPILNNVGTLLASGVSLSSGGRAIQFTGKELRFVRRDAEQGYVTDDREDIPVEEALVGATLSSEAENIREFEGEWLWFAPEQQRVTIEISSRGKPSARFVSKENPGFAWEQESLPPAPELLEVPSVKIEPRRPLLYLAYFGIAFGVFSVVLIVVKKQKTPSWVGTLLILSGVLAILGYSFRQTQVESPTPGDAEEITYRVLRNIYHAFDFRDESSVYDTLSESVTGPLLERVYLEIQNSLQLETTGGPRVKVYEIALRDANRIDTDAVSVKEGMKMQANWATIGEVSHWGHTHERTNRYEAVLTFLPVGEKWKLQNLDLQSEERVQKVSRNRVVAEPVASPENDPNRNESSLEAP